MAEPFESPVDIPGEERPGLGAMAVAVGVATLLLLAFNAHALAAWADGLAPGARSAVIGRVAHGLADTTAALGLDGPRAALYGEWNRWKAARWPDQQAAEPPPGAITQR